MRRLTIDAFAASEFGYGGEAELIESVRKQCDDIISLVAMQDEHVVGHILFSPATIRSGSAVKRGFGLAPMAVLPTHQRCGIRSMLVAEGLRHVMDSTADFTIVAGHKTFYSRFGFRAALDYSISHGFDGMPQDIFFVYVKDGTALSQMSNAKAYYHSAFGPQHQKPEATD